MNKYTKFVDTWALVFNWTVKDLTLYLSRGILHWWVKSAGITQSKNYKCQLHLWEWKGLTIKINNNLKPLISYPSSLNLRPMNKAFTFKWWLKIQNGHELQSNMSKNLDVQCGQFCLYISLLKNGGVKHHINFYKLVHSIFFIFLCCIIWC